MTMEEGTVVQSVELAEFDGVLKKDCDIRDYFKLDLDRALAGMT